MTQSDIKAKLQRVANLSEFAKVAGLKLRTLHRLKHSAPEDYVATAGTLALVRSALRLHRPKMRGAND